MNRVTIQRYYYLTKPGIIYGNAMTAIAGFLLAAKGHPNWTIFAAMLFGTSLVIAGACVFNNYIDRNIDSKMERTSWRALASRKVPVRSAMIYGVILTLAGLALLIAGTNLTTVMAGAIGFIDYVALYSYSKRHSEHSTLVGSISGSMPIVAGYTAARGHFDLTAGLLFLFMSAWQMPHFYAIGIYRLKDYKAAGLPILPVTKGVKATQRAMLPYLVIVLASVLALWLHGALKLISALVLLVIVLDWSRLILNFKPKQADKWARRVFGYSLIIITVMSAILSLNYWI